MQKYKREAKEREKENYIKKKKAGLKEKKKKRNRRNKVCTKGRKKSMEKKKEKEGRKNDIKNVMYNTQNKTRMKEPPAFTEHPDKVIRIK